ncbi:hypothetical protein [Caulobacter sp. FWC2]|uniref:hypothetical protein n=1 Tax=Caulobacter sp. FWC2 TaxID=69664 RepID=UPI000C15931A|nr:hypothetical protein [Caulobacter sp. FWC2]PIB93419.1 hypothetical protein CSW62_18650 [Caulobacter sp. FWC2]
MAAQVLSFFQRSPRYAPKPADWSQQELAEFYRVESALIRAGIRVGTDRGMSDENEPWFCFYRSDDGDVVIHFARIDGEYIIAGPAYEEIARGFDFTQLVRNMVARHPLIRRSESGSNISVHPAALLVAVVGTAFFKSGEARASESGAANGPSQQSRPVLLSSSSAASLAGVTSAQNAPLATYDRVSLPANQAVLILAAALLASDYSVDTTGLDPSAHAAVAAAAASLDFGPGGPAAHAVAVASDGLALAPASHATSLVDNTPVQAVSSVLTLVAILSTLPQASDTSATAKALLTAAGNDEHSSPTLLPITDKDGNWALDVRLGQNVNGLPALEAVQLIRGIVGEAAAQKISVVEVSKLPTILADLIAKGDHHIVLPTQITPAVEAPTKDAPTTTPHIVEPTTPTADTGATTPITGQPAPSQPDVLPDTKPTPTAPALSEPAPSQPTPSQPAPVFASVSLVKSFIDYFLAHTSGVEIMSSGAGIVMFDVRVLHDVGSIVHLESMTFDFADGGSLSLVGDSSSFQHVGILV